MVSCIILDILVQKRRNEKTAMKCSKELLKALQATPLKIVTDKLRRYSAARGEVMPSVAWSTQQYKNNRYGSYHQHSRQQERRIRQLKSQSQAQRFLACYSIINNLFRLGGHQIQAGNDRILSERAFSKWTSISCARDLA
jgi:putative transposase